MTAPSTLPAEISAELLGALQDLIGWIPNASALERMGFHTDAPAKAHARARAAINAALAHPTPPLRQEACGAAASDPQCVPVSAEQAAEIDAALGLKTLPTIRLSDEVHAAAEAAAQREGIIIQAWVRRQIENATTAAASERKLLAQSLRDAIHEALSEAEGAAQNGSLAAQRASEAAAEIWPLLDRLAASPAAALGGEAQPEVPDERSAEFTDCVLVENCARTSPAPAPHAGRETTGQDDTVRLDWLDKMNASLNARYGTKYGWKLVLSPNVVRLLSEAHGGAGHLGAIDLHDSATHGAESCRTAIDAAIAATPGAKP